VSQTIHPMERFAGFFIWCDVDDRDTYETATTPSTAESGVIVEAGERDTSSPPPLWRRNWLQKHPHDISGDAETWSSKH